MLSACKTAASVMYHTYASIYVVHACMQKSDRSPLALKDQMTPAPEDLLKAVMEAVEDLALLKVHTAMIKAKRSHHDDVQ